MFARKLLAVVVQAGLIGSPVTLFAATQTRTSAFQYDPGTGLLTKEIIEPGDPNLCLVTTYTYDAYGNKISATTRNCNGSSGEAAAPTGSAVIATRTTSSAFAAGSVVIGGVTFTYPAGQFATSTTNALSQSETRQFDPRFGTATSLTGPNNLTTTWTYDNFGRKSTETRADSTTTSWSYTLCSGTCFGDGRYFGTIASTGAPTSNSYFDSLNRQIRAETQGFDGTLVRKDTAYDSLGRVAQISKPYLASGSPVYTGLSYDILGRVTQASEPATAAGTLTTTTVYNGLAASVSVDSTPTQTKTTAKNSQGQVVTVTDTQGNTVTYQYDPFGNITQTNAGGVITTLGYDLRGRKTSMNDPDMGVWSYVYDALGQLVSQTDAKSQAVTMVYDVLGRMTSRAEPDLNSTWTYDTCAKGIGKPCQVSADNAYQRTYVYDSLGRVSTLTINIDTAYTVSNTYDSAGRIATITYPTGFAVQNIYNGYGYLSQVQRNDGSGDTTVYWQANSEDAAGNVLSTALGNGLTTTKIYDALFRLTSIASSGAAGTVASFNYTYDILGNVSQRVDNIQSVTENFTYDNLNRLTMASGPNLVTRSFNYDALGDVTYKSDAGIYSYPAAGSAQPHAVSAVSGTINSTYTYDANGNLTGMTLGSDTRTVTYTSFNLPTSITGTANGNAYSYQYTYSSDHERVRLGTTRTDGTSTIIYLHPGGVGSLFYEQETKPDGTVESRHYVQAGSELVGAYVTESVYQTGQAPEMRYYHRDNLGSIAAISNAAGAVLENLAYEAFGKRRFPNGTADPNNTIFGITTARGFTTQEHLDELELIHMNGRIYDPITARFMTPDPFVQSGGNLQSFNRYSYTWNNPLAYSDPSGYFNFGNFIRKYDPISSVLRNIQGTLSGNLGMAMTGFVHSQVPGSIQIDAYIANHPGDAQYAVIAGSAVCGFFTAGVAAAGCAAAVSAYAAANMGGSNSDIIKAGAVTFATAEAFSAVGDATDGHNVDSSYFLTTNGVANIAGHALVGCASAAASGGSCESGAFSGAAGSFATPLASEWGPVGGFITVTVIGGTASSIDGGSFANGAQTAAFGYLFNQAASAGFTAGGHYLGGGSSIEVGGAVDMHLNFCAYATVCGTVGPGTFLGGGVAITGQTDNLSTGLSTSKGVFATGIDAIGGDVQVMQDKSGNFSAGKIKGLFGAGSGAGVAACASYNYCLQKR